VTADLADVCAVSQACLHIGRDPGGYGPGGTGPGTVALYPGQDWVYLEHPPTRGMRSVVRTSRPSTGASRVFTANSRNWTWAWFWEPWSRLAASLADNPSMISCVLRRTPSCRIFS